MGYWENLAEKEPTDNDEKKWLSKKEVLAGNSIKALVLLPRAIRNRKNDQERSKP